MKTKLEKLSGIGLGFVIKNCYLGRYNNRFIHITVFCIYVSQPNGI